MALLNEWIKQGLVPKGDRGPNQGRRPTYLFGPRHYRRVRQILRLRAGGFRDRDAILIQLFLRGYGVAPLEVLEEFIKEAKRARGRLNAPIRSVHADRTGVIPAGPKKALLRQAGELDSVFIDAGLVLEQADLISILRAARAPDEDQRRPNSSDAQVAQLFAGTLDVTADEPPMDDFVRNSLHLFELARSFLQAARDNHLATGMLSPEPEQQRAHFAFRAAMFQREFAAMNFIVLLKQLAQNLDNRTGFPGQRD